MELTLGILIAVGLSAACGFRIFAPPLVAGAAHMLGWIDLATGMEWIGSPIAVTCFAIATCVEVTAYFIPAVNNALDVIATPAAFVAGIIVAAGAMVDLPPLVQWSLAAITAAAVTTPIQLASVSGRAATTATTAGTASPAFSLAETIGSTVTAVLSVVVPIIAAILVFVMLGVAVWTVLKTRQVLRARLKSKSAVAE